MAKVKTITTRESEEPDLVQDPVALAIRTYLTEGGPYPEEVRGQEFKINVQVLDRRGKVIQGEGLQGEDKLEDLYQRILDELGPGRYLVWCQYRRLSSTEKYHLVKVNDVQVGIEEEDAPAAPPGSALQQGAIAPQDRRDVLTTMLAMMQQNTQMMMQQQSTLTSIIVAALTKNNSGSRDLLDAIRTGADLAGARGAIGGEDGEEEDPVMSLVRFGTKTLAKIFDAPDDQAIPAGELKKGMMAEGIDRKMIEQGFQVNDNGEE